MNNNPGESEKPWSVWVVLLVAGLGGLPAQAAGDNAPTSQRIWQTLDVLQLLTLFGVFSLIWLFATWVWARKWRARALREREDEIRRLIDESTKTLQREVAEREAAQRALHESQDLTLRQERLAAVGQLAAGLAHEFNNILTIIQGHASLLLDDPKMDEESVKSITHITDGVERTATLVKQMLAFSRKQVMQQRAVQIKDTMSQIRDMLSRLLGAHVVLRFDIAPQLPPIKADADMLQQVIVNLVANARDAMRSGGQLTIQAEEARFTAADRNGKPERREGCFVQLSVTDTGPGLDANTINHLFEPFFTTKDIGQGTGLGLATVHGMVNQNAGWIEVDSTIGVGTTFNIYFPVAGIPTAETAVAEIEPEKPAPDNTPDASGRPPRGSGETILVVEDEVMLRELVREILEASGYQVLDAAGGAEALAIWEEHRKNIRLLLTDVSMPEGMSGRDLAAKLQQDDPRLPVILSSGYNQDHLEEKQQAGLGQTFLSKPYHPMDLAQAVRASLDSAARGEQSLALPNS